MTELESAAELESAPRMGGTLVLALERMELELVLALEPVELELVLALVAECLVGSLAAVGFPVAARTDKQADK